MIKDNEYLKESASVADASEESTIPAQAEQQEALSNSASDSNNNQTSNYPVESKGGDACKSGSD